MSSSLRLRRLNTANATEGKTHKSAFNLGKPLQGLAIAVSGLSIISCMIEKFNRMRLFTSDNMNQMFSQHGESRGLSSVDIALSVFNDIKFRIDQMLVYLYHRPTSVEDDKLARDVDFSTTPIPVNSCKENNDNTENNGKSKHIKHCHSQSCMTQCRHEHHAHISSWRHAMTVHKSHVPKKMQEPFIEYGYLLPFMPWKYYLKGLYTPSYELMNVWTHLIPSIYFFYLLFAFSQEMDIITAWPLFFITFSGAVLSGFSALAHLFHSRSSIHHSCWFVTDYFGITLFAFASLVTNFYSGALLNYYTLLSNIYLIICLLICATGYPCFCLTQTDPRLISVKTSRRLKVFVNAFGYTFGAIPLYLRMYENFWIGKSETALNYHFLSIICMTVSPIVYGTDFPQCVFPGKFDVFGHSHMWFHVFSGAAAYFSIQAVYHDVVEGPWNILHKQDDYPAFYQIALCYFILVLYGCIVGGFIHAAVKDEHANEEPLLEGKFLCACGLPETAKLPMSARLTKCRSTSSIGKSKEDA